MTTDRPDRYCRIAAGTKKAQIIYETAAVLAFRKKRSPYRVHVKVIPKRHITSLLDVTADDAPLLAEMVFAVQAVAARLNLDGFRVEMNTGTYQNTKHLHWHVIQDDH
jgi:histidine triad (HIT) family protein